MTQVNERRTKILVIEDDECARIVLTKLLGEFCDCPEIGYCRDLGPPIPGEEALKNIESCLRNVPYRAILMDGKLGLELERDTCDGQVLTNLIQRGEYGKLNQRTPIYNTSSSFGIRGTIGYINKERHAEESLKSVGLI